jgi:hypothetical protein
MDGTYSPERVRRYCASVGFCGATYEPMLAPSFEIEGSSTGSDLSIVILLMRTRGEDDFFYETLNLEKRKPSVGIARFPDSGCSDDLDITRAAGRIA